MVMRSPSQARPGGDLAVPAGKKLRLGFMPPDLSQHHCHFDHEQVRGTLPWEEIGYGGAPTPRWGIRVCGVPAQGVLGHMWGSAQGGIGECEGDLPWEEVLGSEWELCPGRGNWGMWASLPHQKDWGHLGGPDQCGDWEL